MNIFIYGTEGFKFDIKNVLEHANINLRLNENDKIKVIDTLIELRTAIENHPKDIFLIDDSKIFRKNVLNKKIKFLKPNDAIEEDFLKEHGIGDLSINSLEDLPKHIIEKLETAEINDEEALNIEESIIGIVDEAYSNEENISEFDEEDDNIQLDDELSSLLSTVDLTDEEEFEEILSMKVDEGLGEDLKELLDENLSSKVDSQEEIEEEKGEQMAGEFSELDSINESDIMAALENLEDIDVNSITPVAVKSAETNSVNPSQENIGVELNSASIGEITSLITKLLSNKTLEITIKVKE